MVDLQIVGGGAAGLCAALYAARAGLSVRVFDRAGGGGQMTEVGEATPAPPAPPSTPRASRKRSK